ncbi:MAG: KEOPS complex subunit Pcc1 [Candidatus Hydrothermarchaeales archaeon]
MKARISFVYENEETAEMVATLLQLDNEIAPRNLKIVTKNEGTNVITDLKHKKLNTFFATIDDLIFSTKIVEDVLGI